MKSGVYDQDDSDRGPEGRSRLPRRQVQEAVQNPSTFVKSFSKLATTNGFKIDKISTGDGGGKAVCAYQSAGQKIAICAWATNDTIGRARAHGRRATTPSSSPRSCSTCVPTWRRPTGVAGPAPVLTRWGRALDPDRPAAGVPAPPARPRAWTNLNGRVGARVHRDAPSARRRTTGRSWCRSPRRPPLSGVGRQLQPDEWLWYRRSFTAPALPPAVACCCTSGRSTSPARSGSTATRSARTPAATCRSRSTSPTSWPGRATGPARGAGARPLRDRCARPRQAATGPRHDLVHRPVGHLADRLARSRSPRRTSSGWCSCRTSTRASSR